MSLFTSIFGGSSSKSQQNQQSDSYGSSVNQSVASSLSGGNSAARSGGVSSSQGTVFSEDLLRQLYGNALGAADSINPSVATDRVNQLFTGGSNIIDKLQGGGAGEDYLTSRLTGDNNSVLNGQIDAIGNDLGRFYNEQLNPAITGSAVAAGQLGGGRQGVAQGAAMSDVLREFATQSGNLRAADITNRDNAALGLLDRQNQSGAVALGALPQLAAIGGNNPQLDVYTQLSDIFGTPTVTNAASSSQFSEEQANQYAESLSQELGISIDEAHSLLTATSKGKGTPGIIGSIGSFLNGGG